ncbi:MAG: type II secretion system F family protein [Chlamydiota bacterium]
MPLYEYWSLSSTGKKRKGYLHAETLLDAKIQLQNTGTLIWKIGAYKKRAHIYWKKEEVLSFTRELAKLLRAGLPLFESLLAMEEKYQGQKPHTVLLDLIEKVQQGKSLSKALSFHEKIFDPLYTKMVEIGEKSGNLENVLLELSLLMEKQASLRKKIIQSTSYPLLLFTFSLLILFGLLFFIIPSLAPLFEDRDLGSFTKAILSLSAFFVAHQNALFLGSMTCLFLGLLSARVERVKSVFSNLLLRLPIVKELLIKHAFIRFSRSTATLLEAGIPLVEAIDLSISVAGQNILEEELRRARTALLEGSSLSKEFEKSPHIPSFVVRMLSIAEKSGKAPEMFQHIALIYEEEFSDSLQKITSYLQPILMLLIGLIVGIVLLSVLLPLTDVSSFIEV